MTSERNWTLLLAPNYKLKTMDIVTVIYHIYCRGLGWISLELMIDVCVVVENYL